jgi:hypothetical protein
VKTPCQIKNLKKKTGKLDSNKSAFQQNQRLQGYQAFQERLAEKNHQLLDGQYENNLSNVTIFCPKHNQSFITTPDNHEKSVYGLPCCAKVGQAQTVGNKNLEDLKNLTVLRGHEISFESLKDYKNQDTRLTFNCLIHNQSFVTTRRLYKRSEFGLNCCKVDPKILPIPKKGV